MGKLWLLYMVCTPFCKNWYRMCCAGICCCRIPPRTHTPVGWILPCSTHSFNYPSVPPARCHHTANQCVFWCILRDFAFRSRSVTPGMDHGTMSCLRFGVPALLKRFAKGEGSGGGASSARWLGLRLRGAAHQDRHNRCSEANPNATREQTAA